VIAPYPDRPGERDRWILALRGPRNRLDPRRPYGSFVEKEASEAGTPVSVATLLLTNRECPWRCLMCDLWQNTLTETTEQGAIPEQLRQALVSLPPARRIKLYNAGSFFDPKAIPPADYGEIARLLDPFERVIVESHPALVGRACLAFRSLLRGELEVAIGLETVHPEVLPRLNKRMTLERFRRAAGFLRENGLALRVFVLTDLPWIPADETLSWVQRSVEFAFDSGATAVSIIATRLGNGALETLRDRGEFSLPDLRTLEAAAARALALRRGRVFADVWSLESLRRCADCFPARVERLRVMNLRQIVPPPVDCQICGGSS
jgi:hypothetical protein